MYKIANQNGSFFVDIYSCRFLVLLPFILFFLMIGLFVLMNLDTGSPQSCHIYMVSKLTGVSCPTIYKVLKEHLGYVSNRLIKLEETNEPK